MILIVACCQKIGYAQTLQPQVIASSGTVTSNATHSISWTLGEVVTQTLVSGGNYATQGFQQPNDDFTISVENNNSTLEIKSYPNPTSDEVHVEINKHSLEDFTFQIMDATGKKVLENKIKASVGTLHHTLQVSEFSAGNYVLTVSNLSSSINKTFKFTKK